MYECRVSAGCAERLTSKRKYPDRGSGTASKTYYVDYAPIGAPHNPLGQPPTTKFITSTDRARRRDELDPYTLFSPLTALIGRLRAQRRTDAVCRRLTSSFFSTPRRFICQVPVGFFSMPLMEPVYTSALR